jgi:hypothetical protein
MNFSNQLLGQRPYENFLLEKQKKQGGWGGAIGAGLGAIGGGTAGFFLGGPAGAIKGGISGGRLGYDVGSKF